MKQFAVKVENEEQYNKLMKACEENGYKWYTSKRKPTEDQDLEGSCYSVDDYPWMLGLNEDKNLVFIAREYYSDVKGDYPLIPFHPAMSYIYGDYKYHYGARVWTKYHGWGTIIGRTDTEVSSYFLIKYDRTYLDMHKGRDAYFLWGHASNEACCEWEIANDIKFSAPEEEEEPLKMSTKFWEPRKTTREYREVVMINPVLNNGENCYTVIRNHNTVIVILEDGRKGFAVCSPKDGFDFNTGFEIAYRRAVGK